MSKQVELHNEVMLIGRIMSYQKNNKCNNRNNYCLLNDVVPARP